MSNSRRNRQASVGPIQVLELQTTEVVEEEQKFETLFTIDGKSYDLWVNPPASVGLRYLKEVREQGQESASVWLLYQMIGEDGYDALMNFPGLQEKQLTDIVKICKEYSMGDDKGNG